MKKKHSPVAQAIESPTVVSNLSASSPSLAEDQNRSTARYIPPVYPYTPSRSERRQYVQVKLRGEPVWVNEPEWVKRCDTNHERNNSQGKSTIFSISPKNPRLPSPGCQLSPPGRQPSLPGRQLSPTTCPTPFVHIPPPPKLQPLLFTNTTSSPTANSTGNQAAHAAWWARISNTLASYSARSYHLFVASSFLTCKTEELLLLYQIRKLNADGTVLFEEVMRGLQARIACWEGSIDELRISWDMESKREQVVRYDAFVAEQVARLERELSGGDGQCYDDGNDDEDEDEDEDSETVVNSRPSQDEFAGEGSSCENYPNAMSQLDEIEALGESITKNVVLEPEDHKDCSPPNRSLVSRSAFDLADDAIEAFQNEGKNFEKGQEGQEGSSVSKPAVTNSRVDAAASPSPRDISPPTWAEVLASPVKIVAFGIHLVKGPDDPSSQDWGFSGEAWDWERNWE